MSTKCGLAQQGYMRGSCITRMDGKGVLACEATLKEEGGRISRLIESIHLSRPENYLSLYIPKVVETPQLREIGILLSRLDRNIPFTILAFFPENQMKDYRHPNAQEMVEAFHEVKATGLKKVRLGNTGLFAQGDEDYRLLKDAVGVGNF